MESQIPSYLEDLKKALSPTFGVFFGFDLISRLSPYKIKIGELKYFSGSIAVG
jgi:hypothetical protein